MELDLRKSLVGGLLGFQVHREEIRIQERRYNKSTGYPFVYGYGTGRYRLVLNGVIIFEERFKGQLSLGDSALGSLSLILSKSSYYLGIAIEDNKNSFGSLNGDLKDIGDLTGASVKVWEIPLKEEEPETKVKEIRKGVFVKESETLKKFEPVYRLNIYSEEALGFLGKILDDAMGDPKCFEGDHSLGREVMTMRNDVILKRKGEDPISEVADIETLEKQAANLFGTKPLDTWELEELVGTISKLKEIQSIQDRVIISLQSELLKRVGK